MRNLGETVGELEVGHRNAHGKATGSLMMIVMEYGFPFFELTATKIADRPS
jgi:hypothetical protein